MSDVIIVKEGWVQKRGKCFIKLRVMCWVSVLIVSGGLEGDIFFDVVNKVNCDILCLVREKGYLIYALEICLLFSDFL